MSNPFRVVVWGPGGLGTICVREMIQKQEFELAGVFAYSESKVGQDAGELVGLDPVGTDVVGEMQQALAIDCDCVIYLARDLGVYNYTDEILEILKAGRNVISVLPIQHLEFVGDTCDPEFTKKVAEACEAGQSTFHCTGIHPNFVADRLAVPLTGLCNHIEHYVVQENWDVAHISATQLEVVGYGMSPEEASKLPHVTAISENYLKMKGLSMGKAMGIDFDRVEIEHEFIPAEKDIATDHLSIKKGTVGRVTHRHKAYINANDDKPFQVFEDHWCLTPEMYPEGITPDQYYVVTIEGRPSVKLTLDIQSSFDRDEHFVVEGDPSSAPGYYATVSTCIHAVPKVVAAAPGVLDSPVPSWRWAPDYREM